MRRSVHVFAVAAVCCLQSSAWQVKPAPKRPVLSACSVRAAILGAVLASTCHVPPSLAASLGLDLVDQCVQKATVTGMQVKCERHGLRSDRLLGCDSAEACVSTSAVKSPSKFASPWRLGSSGGTFASLMEEAKKANIDVVYASDADKDRQYIYGQVKGPRGGIDDVEFLVNEKERLVFYRSATRLTEYVYPFQQPINDQVRRKQCSVEREQR
eukprot:scaffold898_cov229-Pinguiococcus_pyrenoidosus.AAC.16